MRIWVFLLLLFLVFSFGGCSTSDEGLPCQYKKIDSVCIYFSVFDQGNWRYTSVPLKDFKIMVRSDSKNSTTLAGKYCYGPDGNPDSKWEWSSAQLFVPRKEDKEAWESFLEKHRNDGRIFPPKD